MSSIESLSSTPLGGASPRDSLGKISGETFPDRASSKPQPSRREEILTEFRERVVNEGNDKAIKSFAGGGLVIGALVGALVGGPIGAAIGAMAGAMIGALCGLAIGAYKSSQLEGEKGNMPLFLNTSQQKLENETRNLLSDAKTALNGMIKNNDSAKGLDKIVDRLNLLNPSSEVSNKFKGVLETINEYSWQIKELPPGEERNNACNELSNKLTLLMRNLPKSL